MRITWVQPEDLLPHELTASRDEGRDVTALAQRWAAAGGDLTPPVSGASKTPASPALRALAAELLDAADALPAVAADDETDDLAALRAQWPATWSLPTDVAYDRLHGAWLGRAAGCLLGKPVEKIPGRGSGRSSPPPGVGRCATGSPRRGCRPRSPNAGRGTGAARRPASPRTSTACPRTTT
ncbi:hypothetical protein GCM10027614_02140 [Micromonospora vulcania]